MTAEALGGAPWQAALAYALTEQELALPLSAGPDIEALVAALAAAGWDADVIAEHARSVAGQEQPWPHAVPASLRAGCGAAQLQAALTAVREALDLVTLEKRPPAGARSLTADEQRLLREMPPHHVG